MDYRYQRSTNTSSQKIIGERHPATGNGSGNRKALNNIDTDTRAEEKKGAYHEDKDNISAGYRDHGNV